MNLRNKRGFIFDLDGVVYLGNRPIDGAAETIKLLRAKKKKIAFITNNSTESREGFCRKLRNLGIMAGRKEIFTSSFATAKWLGENFKGGRVLVVGEAGLRHELRGAGFEIVESRANFVVVGLDKRFNYEKLQKACFALQKGALFISTNQDATYPTESGMLPGGGVMVNALKTCSGKNVLVDIGKPNGYMLRIALRQMNLGRREVVLIGDRLETDMAMANQFGIASILVLTGVTQMKDLKTMRKNMKPDMILDSIRDLAAFV